MNKIICHIDGSCEPINPGGRMGIGVVIQFGGVTKNYSDSYEENENNSSNLAEYLGLKLLLKLTQDYSDCEIEIKSDSQLLVNQMLCRWKIKRGAYVETARTCLKEILRLQSEKNITFNFKWVPRYENKHADNLSKL